MGVKRDVATKGMNHELAARNLNIIYLSGCPAQDVAFQLDADPHVKNLSDTQVQDILQQIDGGPSERAILLGYDGDIKLVSRDQVRLTAVFDKIDTMPMRKREICSEAFGL